MKFRFHHLPVKDAYIFQKKKKNENEHDKAHETQITYDDHGEMIIGNRQDTPKDPKEEKEQNKKKD